MRFLVGFLRGQEWVFAGNVEATTPELAVAAAALDWPESDLFAAIPLSEATFVRVTARHKVLDVERATPPVAPVPLVA